MRGFNLKESLTERRYSELYRSRKVLSSAQEPEVCIDGRQVLAFCSNDYLGLANHPEIIAATKQAVNQFGVGGGASHLISGHSQPHHQLEEELAEFTGRSRALLFANGYMANLGVITALLSKTDAVFQDRLNHASLLDAGLLSGARFYRYLHRDCDSLEKKLSRSSARRKLIVTDGVFSMDGDIAPLPKLAAIASKNDAWLMVDDAHGFGVLGEAGRGSAEHFQLSQQELPVLMGTLGKACGTYGAFVAGSEELIETLIQFARPYIYTTSLPPAIAEATRTSLRLIKQEDWRRNHLQNLVAYFRQCCNQAGIKLMNSTTPIQPLMVGNNRSVLAISQGLYQQGILVSAIRPPTVPEGTSRLRITLSARHTREQVDRLVSALEKTIIHHMDINERESVA
ncbi:8-amino-7-oxononanoate synthase [Endozoicomonas sp. Mp262]|uniref:8-amino-7-oxononanoate synthase n=1 Tax=Endozoicomonas sp. Mp262 TaxID=2919499 RepID=UPI0021D8B85E